MPKVRIELATENNLSVLLPLVREYHEFEEIRLAEVVRKNSLRTLLADKSLGGIWMVYQNTSLTGYIALCVGYSIEFAGLDAFVDEFYILPAFRRKGVGSKVLELIKVEARKMQIQAIHLEVARINKQAQAFYKKANFKPREKYLLMSVDL